MSHQGHHVDFYGKFDAPSKSIVTSAKSGSILKNKIKPELHHIQQQANGPTEFISQVDQKEEMKQDEKRTSIIQSLTKPGFIELRSVQD